MTDYSASVDVNDFLTEFEPEYNWCIPGVLEQGDRLIITGNEGKGKSTLMRQWAIQIAMGLHPFTEEEMPPKKVWLVDLENPRTHLRREIKKIKRGLPIDPGYLTIDSWPQGLDLSNTNQQMSMMAHLAEVKPDIMFIGPLYKMHPNMETEQAAAQLAFQIDQWRAKYGCTVIIEGHQPHQVITQSLRFRPERPIGSSLWLRWPEFGICLEDDGTLRHWRGARDEREWPAKLVRGTIWLWQVDDQAHTCLVCGQELEGRQARYCSEKCGVVARKREQRARSRV